MTLLTFVATCAIGSGLSFLTAARPRSGRAVALLSIAAALLASLSLRPGETVLAGDVQLAPTWYAGFFLSSGLAGCLALTALSGRDQIPRQLPGAALATFGLLGLALSARDPGAGLLAAAAAALPGLIVVTAAGGPRRRRAMSELRIVAALVGGAALAAVCVEGAAWTGNAAAVAPAVAYLAIALAVALRSGAVPFHVPAARLGRDSSVAGLALLLVWIPVGFAALALSWAETATTAGAAIAGPGGIVIAIGIVTVLLGAVGALLHDELAEVAVYSIAQDAGFLLLALGARDSAVSNDARLWLVAYLVSKTALVCWVAAMTRSFRTSALHELSGWARRSPLLCLALLGLALATLGWPGYAVFEARADLVSHALGDPFAGAGLVALVLSVAVYGRLIAIGLLEPSATVSDARGDVPRWPAPAATAPSLARLTRLPQVAFSIRGAAKLAGGASRVAAIAEANATPVRHLLVAATALVAMAVAFGGFGADRASSSGWALQAAIPSATSGLQTLPPANGDEDQPVESIAPDRNGQKPSASAETNASSEPTASPGSSPSASMSSVRPSSSPNGSNATRSIGVGSSPSGPSPTVSPR